MSRSKDTPEARAASEASCEDIWDYVGRTTDISMFVRNVDPPFEPTPRTIVFTTTYQPPPKSTSRRANHTARQRLANQHPGKTRKQVQAWKRQQQSQADKAKHAARLAEDRAPAQSTSAPIPISDSKSELARRAAQAELAKQAAWKAHENMKKKLANEGVTR